MKASGWGEEFIQWSVDFDEPWEEFIDTDPGDVWTLTPHGRPAYQVVIMRVDEKEGRIWFRRFAGNA